MSQSRSLLSRMDDDDDGRSSGAYMWARTESSLKKFHPYLLGIVSGGETCTRPSRRSLC